MTNITILLITIFANSFLSLLILFKKRKNLKDVNLISFLVGIVFLILWSIFNYLADNAQILEVSLFWTRATFPASLFVIWFILWFSFSFPKKIFNYTKINIIYFFVVLFFSIFSMTKQVVFSIGLERGVGVTDVELGRLYPFIMILYLLMVGNIIFNLFHKYKKLRGIERMQVSYVILGWSVFIIGGLVTNLILPFVTGNANWSKFGPLISIVMVAFAAYAIVRYKFLDIRIIIQKSLVYSSLLIIIGGLYLIFISIIAFIFQQSTHIATLLSAGFITVVGIFGIPIVKKYFDKWSDKLFFKNKYDFSEAIYDLSEILNRNLNLEILKKEILFKLKQLLKTKSISLYLKDDLRNKEELILFCNYLQNIVKTKKVIFTVEEVTFLLKKTKLKSVKSYFDKLINNKQNTELFVFLKIKQKIIGIMVLSSKLSDEAYSSDDRNLLKSISYQMSVSIDKARLYKKIKNYSQDLEKKVKERTYEINELQNEQKQIMQDISHGLQTPLTVIKGELELLQKKSPDNKKLITFEKSLDRISMFISDLLSLSRLETKQTEIDLKKINLSSALEEMVEYFAVILQAKKIVFAKNIEANISINGNEEQIEELMNSLVSNSIKYIGSGNRISINLKLSGEWAVLSVKDNGIGISAKEIPLVLNRFYRAENNNNKGSGLGLSICKKIVDLHHGHIEILSELEEGTEIIVSFRVV